MAQEFVVPAPWAKRGWRLKIRDRERVEPPYVTLLCKTRSWRFGLRERAFLDADPPERDVPGEMVRNLEDRIDEFAAVWDSLHPENPVKSNESEDI
jgi:hypothetical protein